jgi:hypothetical protein
MSAICPTCGGSGQCPTCRSRTVNDDVEEEDDWDDLRREVYAPCGCRFCFCMNETLYGVACPSCMSGAHQG